MIWIKRAGACLVSVLVMSALAVPSALAFTEEPPEAGRCLKLAGGRFKDAGCKTAAKVATEQKFEWYPAFGPNGKGEEKLVEKSKLIGSDKSKEATVISLETITGEKVTCKEQHSGGEITGPKTGRAFGVTFTGCEAVASPCTSTNPKATNKGEILVKELDGSIGIEKFGATAPTNKIATLFVPAEGEIFTEFECVGLKVIVKGELMVPLTANKMALSTTVKFTAIKGKQKPEKFATDPAGTKRILFSKLGSGEFVQAGQTLTDIATGMEKLEASTVN